VSSEFVPMDLEPELELEPAALLDMPLRVWAEIGRVRMPAAFVVGMPQGAIVDLDCDPDAPADLFVNGRHFGTGRLVLVEGEWALRVETLDADGESRDGAASASGDAEVEHSSSPAQQPPADAD
jgi:flagellar motor switch/type III secretory pathway protein FliN